MCAPRDICLTRAVGKQQERRDGRGAVQDAASAAVPRVATVDDSDEWGGDEDDEDRDYGNGENEVWSVFDNVCEMICFVLLGRCVAMLSSTTNSPCRTYFV